jgi:hypothetical protein
MNLDRQLREALARKNPPPEMVDRVVARIEQRDEAGLGRREGIARPEGRVYLHRAYVLQLAAVLLIFLAIGFGVVRQREAARERQRAETAARQLMTALQIASETLNDAQRIVQQTY